MGEAPARSFLVPRNGTAEFVFDCPRFARGLLMRVRLTASWFAVVGWLLCLVFTVVFSVVGNLFAFPLSLVCFC